MMARNPEKARKEAKLQKKQTKKDKHHGYGSQEERLTLAGKKPPSTRRNKTNARHNSQSGRHIAGRSEPKIHSMAGLFGECSHPSRLAEGGETTCRPCY